MIFLILSIVCSVTVGVLFKLSTRYQINIAQAVTWNYLFAMVLSLVFFKPNFSAVSINSFPLIYWILGLLMPSLFVILAYSVRKAGLARTDVAQRLSLFISLCAAYFLFKENFNTYKQIGVTFGFAAITLTMYRKSNKLDSKANWIYLFLVFLGFGVVDILFKMVSQFKVIPYTTALFIIYTIAFCVALLYLFYLISTKKTKLQFINFVCGCILGFFNFGNILFYLKAHQSLPDNPSTVFAGMNIGVILVGSFLGISLFKEKFSKWNYLGLVCAIISIVLITLSKIYAV